MEFGFVMKYLTKVWCACGVHFVQNTANGCVAFKLHQFSLFNGITGCALKRDALSTHMTTAAHLRWLY